MRILFYILLISFINGQPIPENFKRVKENFNNSPGFYAEFTQTTINIKNKINRTLKGKIWLKVHNKLKIELPKVTITSDGKTVWNHDERLKRVIISSMDDEESSVFNFESVINQISETSTITETVTSDGKFEFKIIPKKIREFVIIKLLCDKKYDILNLEIKDVTETIYKIDLLNKNSNIKITDNHFVFQIPKGLQVIDLRDDK